MNIIEKLQKNIKTKALPAVMAIIFAAMVITSCEREATQTVNESANHIPTPTVSVVEQRNEILNLIKEIEATLANSVIIPEDKVIIQVAPTQSDAIAQAKPQITIETPKVSVPRKSIKAQGAYKFNSDNTYTVENGDTLANIIYAFCKSGSTQNINQVARANNITNPDIINIGATIDLSILNEIKKTKTAEVAPAVKEVPVLEAVTEVPVIEAVTEVPVLEAANVIIPAEQSVVTLPEVSEQYLNGEQDTIDMQDAPAEEIGEDNFAQPEFTVEVEAEEEEVQAEVEAEVQAEAEAEVPVEAEEEEVQPEAATEEVEAEAEVPVEAEAEVPVEAEEEEVQPEADAEVQAEAEEEEVQPEAEAEEVEAEAEVQAEAEEEEVQAEAETEEVIEMTSEQSSDSSIFSQEEVRSLNEETQQGVISDEDLNIQANNMISRMFLKMASNDKLENKNPLLEEKVKDGEKLRPFEAPNSPPNTSDSIKDDINENNQKPQVRATPSQSIWAIASLAKQNTRG